MTNQSIRNEEVRKEEFTRSMREIRRANHGVQACAQVLARHDENGGSLPGSAQVFIRLEDPEVGGLHCAMLELSRLIERRLSEIDEDHDFGWHEEYYGKVRKSSDIDKARKRGEITFDQAIKASDRNEIVGNISTFEPLEDIKNGAI